MSNPKCDLPCENEQCKIIHINEKETEILEYRFSFPVKYLCQEHYYDQFSRYESWHKKKCSDPCLRHKGTVKSNLKLISLSVAKKVKLYTEYSVTPGKSYCYKCFVYLNEAVADGEKKQEHQEPSKVSEEQADRQLEAGETFVGSPSSTDSQE